MRTLQELDYLLGVSDVSQLGALRFRNVGEQLLQSPTSIGVRGLVELRRLLQITERILRDEETGYPFVGPLDTKHRGARGLLQRAPPVKLAPTLRTRGA